MQEKKDFGFLCDVLTIYSTNMTFEWPENNEWPNYVCPTVNGEHIWKGERFIS